MCQYVSLIYLSVYILNVSRHARSTGNLNFSLASDALRFDSARVPDTSSESGTTTHNSITSQHTSSDQLEYTISRVVLQR